MIDTLVGGRYRLIEILGEGGMGVVYRGVDEQLDRPVAVKLIRHHGKGIDLVERLEREARAAARLGHPNIVPVLDFAHGDGGEPFIVMQLLEGRSMRAVLKDGPMPIGRALELHIQLLDGLAAAHRASVVHRDLKPANFIITPLGPRRELVRILDFGLAYLLEDGAKKLTQHGIALGTPAYIAPERIAGEPTTQSCDLYSIGVCLYEALAGERPFDDPSPAVLQGRVVLFAAPDIRTPCPDVPADLAEAIAKALAKTPAERFASAEQMRDHLQAILDGLAPEHRGAVVATTSEERSERSEQHTRFDGGVGELEGGAEPARSRGETVRLGSLPAPVETAPAVRAISEASQTSALTVSPETVSPETVSPKTVLPKTVSPETAYELPVVGRSFWRPFAAGLGVVVALGAALIGVALLTRGDASEGPGPEGPVVADVEADPPGDAAPTEPPEATAIVADAGVSEAVAAIPTHPEVTVGPAPTRSGRRRALPTPVVEPPVQPVRPPRHRPMEVLEPRWD